MELVSVIGYGAAIFGTIAFIPQVYKCWQTKQTKAISLPAYLILAIATFLWTTYGILNRDIPIIAANFIVCGLSIFLIFLKIKHG